MKPKKILVIAPYGFNDRMSSFIEFVSARVLAKNGWKVFALAKSDNNICGVEHVHGINIYRYNSLLRGLFFGVRIIFMKRPSIVHFHNLRNNRVGILISMLSKLLRIPLVFTEYGLLHDHYLTDDRDDPLNQPMHPERVIMSIRQVFLSLRKGMKIRDAFSSYVFHWPLAHADAAIFISKHNLRIAELLGVKHFLYLPHIMDDYRWGVTGVDLNEDTRRQHEQILETLQKIKSEKNVLFIGQMKLRKGWDILLRAIPHIPESIVKNIIVVSASGNASSREFTLLADSLGVGHRIVFLGQVLDSKILQDIYTTSEAVLVPSRYEGFGLVPTEAFAIKKPVIATQVEALSDFLTDGYNALLVDKEDHQKLAEAIVRVMTDSNIALRLVKGGEATLQKMKSKEGHQKWLYYYETFLKI